jgi:hypothetical protein
MNTAYIEQQGGSNTYIEQRGEAIETIERYVAWTNKCTR